MGRPKEGDYEFCTRCGKKMYRPPSHRKRGRPFCSRQCHMKTLNEELNPFRMTPEIREKLRQAHLNTGEGKTYTKLYGRHEHRVVAESMLGRPLEPGEIVHHKNRKKRDNAPENLEVLASQSDHAKLHAAEIKGGDADEVHP